jgi:serine/threonine-protein kinase
VDSLDQSVLALIDRKGVATPLKAPPGVYEYPRVSPDGTRLVFGTSDGKAAVISTYELSGASAVRQLTFEGNNRFPIWSADGSRVAFQSDRNGDPAVFWQSADGGIAEPLTTPDPGTSHTPESWSPDGKVLLFTATKGTISSLWTYSLEDRKAVLFGGVKGSTLPANALFSHDGRRVAYQFGQPGVTEATLYVEPFPPDGTKQLIAQQGGRPLWSRDGKELFYVPAPGRFVVVGVVKTAPIPTFTNEVDVPRGFGPSTPSEPRTFDILPDGRIVGVVPAASRPTQVQQIHVVLNWFEELKAKVPAK